MKPKEKAKELVAKFTTKDLKKSLTNIGFTTEQIESGLRRSKLQSKKYATIVVRELINSMSVQQSNEDEYWFKVLIEIEKI